MNELQRLTTEYVEKEDRIRISGELASSETIVLWISQRLLNRLLPHLFLWLEKQSSDKSFIEIKQHFAQEAAKADLASDSPVQTLALSQEWLIEAVDLTPSANSICLNFRSASGQNIPMTLQTIALRQWLTIIYSLWSIAEWSTDKWPAWALPNKKDSEESSLSIYH